MITRWLFVGIVICVILQRLFELRISQRNATEILAQGGQEYNDNLLGVVKVVQISWWVAMIAEVWYFNRVFIPSLAVIGLIATIIGQFLRYLSMKELGIRWTLTIMTIPGIPLIDTGIYRYIRHPNWLGVCLEIAGLPLIHNAYLTAITFSLINFLIMVKRMNLEESALTEETFL